MNDREFGGVFFSHDNGQHWQQRSAGLGGKDVFTLRQASSGALVAGTNHGSYILEHNGMEWHPINTVVVEKTATKTVKKGKKNTQVASKTVTKSTLDARVNEVDISGDRWMEATNNGLYFSKDQGKSWMGGPVQGEKEFLSVRGRGNTIVAAARTKVYVSHDNGTTFTEHSMTQYVTSIRGITLTPEGRSLWLPAKARSRARTQALAGVMSWPDCRTKTSRRSRLTRLRTACSRPACRPA